MPNLRFHDLRHSCATLLLGQGVSPRVVMEILGHFQIGVTMNTYVSSALQREASDRLNNLLEQAAPPPGDSLVHNQQLGQEPRPDR
jgi:integrase